MDGKGGIGRTGIAVVAGIGIFVVVVLGTVDDFLGFGGGGYGSVVRGHEGGSGSGCGWAAGCIGHDDVCRVAIMGDLHSCRRNGRRGVIIIVKISY